MSFNVVIIMLGPKPSTIFAENYLVSANLVSKWKFLLVKRLKQKIFMLSCIIFSCVH